MHGQTSHPPHWTPTSLDTPTSHWQVGVPEPASIASAQGGSAQGELQVTPLAPVADACSVAHACSHALQVHMWAASTLWPSARSCLPLKQMIPCTSMPPQLQPQSCVCPAVPDACGGCPLCRRLIPVHHVLAYSHYGTLWHGSTHQWHAMIPCDMIPCDTLRQAKAKTRQWQAFTLAFRHRHDSHDSQSSHDSYAHAMLYAMLYDMLYVVTRYDMLPQAMTRHGRPCTTLTHTPCSHHSTSRASTSRAVWSETRHAMPYSHPHAMHTPQHIQSTSRAVRSETGKSYNMLGTGQQLQQWTCADQWLHRHVGWCLPMCLWDSRGGLALCLWLCRGGLLWPSAT